MSETHQNRGYHEDTSMTTTTHAANENVYTFSHDRSASTTQALMAPNHLEGYGHSHGIHPAEMSAENTRRARHPNLRAALSPACADSDVVLHEAAQHQSFVERNIWSIFNPLWTAFPVRRPRLSNASDSSSDWTATTGRPRELRRFLGLNNPANCTWVSLLMTLSTMPPTSS